jgi:3-deoxy-7-phosphoheptulonate synthase
MFCSTQTSASGLKTRHFGTIIGELAACLRIHAVCKLRLSEISLEFMGELNEKGFSVGCDTRNSILFSMN